MTVATLVAFLQSLPAAFMSIVNRPIDLGASNPSRISTVDRLTKLIESRTIAIKTLSGGIIHRVTPEQAPKIAAIIIKAAADNRVPLSMLQALLDGESRDDESAENANTKLAKPGETADAAFLHTDYGMEEEDGSSTIGDPAFKGLTTAQIIDKLLDPVYGANFAARTLSRNLARAKNAFAAEPHLADRVPNGDYRVLGTQAYNSGFDGAETIARLYGRAGNWSYGTNLVTKADSWKAVLDV